MKHLTMWKVEKNIMVSEFDWNAYFGEGRTTTKNKTVIGYYNTPKEAEDKVFELTGEKIVWLSKRYFRKQIECSDKICFEELYRKKSKDALSYEICAAKRMRKNNSTEHHITYCDSKSSTTATAEWYEINAQTFSWSGN